MRFSPKYEKYTKLLLPPRGRCEQTRFVWIVQCFFSMNKLFSCQAPGCAGFKIYFPTERRGLPLSQKQNCQVCSISPACNHHCPLQCQAVCKGYHTAQKLTHCTWFTSSDTHTLREILLSDNGISRISSISFNVGKVFSWQNLALCLS